MTPAPDRPPLTKTTDRQNTSLSLQFLRLYADQTTVASAYVLRASGCPLPTFHAFVQASLRIRN
jgi:hypothetical protein